MRLPTVATSASSIHRAGTAVIEVVSAFLYQSRFTDYENAFETTEEPDYLANLLDDVSFGVCGQRNGFSGITNATSGGNRALFPRAIPGHLQRQNMYPYQATYPSTIN
jgi:hypothetical protein